MSEIWDRIYKERRQKVGKKKARFSANAVEKSKYVKEFLKDSMVSKIKNIWNKKIEIIIAEKIEDYKVYEVEGVNFIINSDIKLLKEDLKNIIKKGKVGEITDEYTREIIMKAKEENDNIVLNPNLYYVIYKG